MIKDKILIIDDESGIRSSLKGILEDEGYEVKTVDTGEKGLTIIKNENFNLVFLDIWLPEINGIEVLKKLKSFKEDTQVVMITGHGSVESAVKATKLGAFNFLEKPLSLEKVVLTAKNALRQKALEEENIQLRGRIKSHFQLIGKSPAIKNLKQQIQTTAPSNSQVLITGENGTGKEHIARLIHQQSPRKNKHFIQINSAAIPDDLIESELFGYEKDAFPNARKDKQGKMLIADKGTLFLDEIGEMSLKTQENLVRFLETGKFQPLGSTQSIAVDIRVIASTDKNIRELVTQNKFRKDLFFKLNVIPMFIPPLRERKEDIPLLINYYLEYFSKETGKKQKSMNKEAMKAFINYSWPGNVSELINVIERFVIMIKEDEIKSSHLFLLVEPREIQFMPGFNKNFPLKKARVQFDKEFIHKALIHNDWDLPRTAQELEIEQTTLEANIKRLGIQFSS